jgi:hypothetical protein
MLRPYYNLGVAFYNQGEFKKASSAFKRARKQYRQQGNTEQANKIEQLMQQVAQMQEPKQPQVSQVSQDDLSNPDTPINTEANPSDIPTPEEINPEEVPFSLEPSPGLKQ